MKTFGNTKHTEEYGVANPEASEVEGVVIVGYDPKINKWLALEWDKLGTIWLAGGGKDANETYQQAAIRELKEETGFFEFQDQIQLGGSIISHYYNDKKAKFRRSYSFAFLFILDSKVTGQQELEEHEQFMVKWMDYGPLRQAIKKTGGGVEHWLAVLTMAHEYVLQPDKTSVQS